MSQRLFQYILRHGMTITAVTFLYDGQCDHITPREIRSVIYTTVLAKYCTI